MASNSKKYEDLEKAVEAAIFELEMMYDDLVKIQELIGPFQATLATADSIYQKTRDNLLFLKKEAQVVSIDRFREVKSEYLKAAGERINSSVQLDTAASELVQLKKNISTAEKSLHTLKAELYSTPRTAAKSATILEFPYGKRRRDAQQD